MLMCMSRPSGIGIKRRNSDLHDPLSEQWIQNSGTVFPSVKPARPSGDVVIDEAAFHESLDELLKAAMALTMWGARVRIISTHNGVDNLFNQYIQEAREGRKDYSVHRITPR